MSDFEKLINASDLIEWIMETYPDWCDGAVRSIVDHVENMPSATPKKACEPEIIRCKDCKHQEKFFQKDGRRKDGGYYIYGCYLAEEYSHVCLDDDYCSRAERKERKHETD